jgi:hypothetical protein
MTIGELLSKPEFWSALFGALAAFFLGALATWWTNLSTKRTAGNLTVIALSQMCSLMENLRYELLVKEPIRIQGIMHRGPYPFEIRPAAGLPERLPQIQAETLGFLADSHDPDIFNRLLTVERAFAAMIDVIRRREVAHARITERMNVVDPTGQLAFGPDILLRACGAKPLIDLDVLTESLEKGLPETRDMLLEVAKQLHNVLRMQIPFRRFVGFSSIPRTRLADQPPDLPKPSLWRRITRWSFDFLMKRRRLVDPPKAPQVAPADPTPPVIKRFPPRSWEIKGPGPPAGAG